MVKNTSLEEKDLPIRLVASTPCFRKEAGSYGKDTKGMFRQHQFYKVELVSIVDPNKCKEELDRMINCAEEILKKLKLPFRSVLLSSGDMGFSAEKTVDLEVWIPSENKYREISSCSSCGQFQSRRMKAKYKDTNKQAKNKYGEDSYDQSISYNDLLIATFDLSKLDTHTPASLESLILTNYFKEEGDLPPANNKL